jgi:hypothetical protein
MIRTYESFEELADAMCAGVRIPDKAEDFYEFCAKRAKK